MDRDRVWGYPGEERLDVGLAENYLQWEAYFYLLVRDRYTVVSYLFIVYFSVSVSVTVSVSVRVG